MYSKILIKGEIEVLTGLHIGTGGEYAAIGAADSPVVRDAVTNSPIIPGSSLKGKLRSLLARAEAADGVNNYPKTADEDCENVKRLFGSKEHLSRLIFSDMPLNNLEELRKMDVNSTEVKFENTINRLTSVANPRQIERAIRGCKFDMSIIYDIKNKAEAKEDMDLLAEAMQLLKYDYLGGSGSRGYGKVKFNNLSAEAVVGEDDEELMNYINEVLKGVM